MPRRWRHKNLIFGETDNIVVHVRKYTVQAMHDLIDDLHKPRGRCIGALWHAQNFEQLRGRAKRGQGNSVGVGHDPGEGGIEVEDGENHGLVQRVHNLIHAGYGLAVKVD